MKLYPRGANQAVLETHPARILFSYRTPVAAHTNGRYIRTEQHLSRTTSRHISQWLRACNQDPAEVDEVPQAELDALADPPAQRAAPVCGSTTDRDTTAANS